MIAVLCFKENSLWIDVAAGAVVLYSLNRPSCIEASSGDWSFNGFGPDGVGGAREEEPVPRVMAAIQEWLVSTRWLLFTGMERSIRYSMDLMLNRFWPWVGSINVPHSTRH
jgi:hypothetical protein